MKIVIDIDEKYYNDIKNSKSVNNYSVLYALDGIRNGIPLPKGHGNLIDTNEITAFRELECNGHDVESLDEFTVIIEADKEDIEISNG